jgi:hypothetical protein
MSRATKAEGSRSKALRGDRRFGMLAGSAGALACLASDNQSYLFVGRCPTNFSLSLAELGTRDKLKFVGHFRRSV